MSTEESQKRLTITKYKLQKYNFWPMAQKNTYIGITNTTQKERKEEKQHVQWKLSLNPNPKS